MLKKILAEADPVVTASRTSLRLESFSACCSAYARHDLGPAALEIDHISPGTTNVDFQAPLRAALAKVRGGTSLSLSVGSSAVEVQAGTDTLIERKVPLPLRWIKGFGEVQVHLARMTRRLVVSGVEGLRFVRNLPRGNTRHTSWVVPAGAGIRLTQRAQANGVRVTAAERLRVIESLVQPARELQVYADDASGSSAWVLDFGDQRFSFVISPSRWRGFSGEGQLLDALSDRRTSAALARVRAGLNWQDTLDPAAIASGLGLDTQSVSSALTVLASRGLVGFDLESASFFHRVLPFDLSKVEDLQPRLKSARRLVEAGHVRFEEEGTQTVAKVVSGDVIHRVVITADSSSCSCPWHAKHQGARGPCKHTLAVQIMAEER